MSNQITKYKEMKQFLTSKLSEIIPEDELIFKSELAVKINELKKEKNAIILGHNYMEPALYYSITDIVGDSLELCREAAKMSHDIIVFCGVKFMAETAKILNPNKKVLIPSMQAGCSLAESVNAEDVRKLKELIPNVPVVTYVNTYADVKAETDICCTSGNASKVVQSLNSEKVIFLPDEYLAKNVASETNKKIVIARKNSNNDIIINGNLDDYDMIGWQGKCEVHDQFNVDDIKLIREQYPDVVVLAHPECSPEVVAASDFSGSTKQMIQYVEENEAPLYLLLTECSMGDNILAANPDRNILRLCSIRCPHMKQITLEDTLYALQQEKYEVHVPKHIQSEALKAVQRMIST